MTKLLPNSDESLAHIRGRELAELAIESADLINFIRYWNNGDLYASLIASVDHLHNALGFDEELSRRYDLICELARTENCEIDFLIWLSVLLTPTICTSFVNSLLMQCQVWAREALQRAPVAIAAPMPFSNGDALARGILTTVERPPIAGPAGETILDADVGERLLLQALRAEMPSVLQGSRLRRLEEHTATPSDHLPDADTSEA